jgi:aminoglycoside phosphotransferase (APT) family kinase protein
VPDAPTSDAVRAALADALGRDPGEVELSPLPGGASRQTFLVDGAEDRWVLRRDPPGATSYAPLLTEFGLMTAARAAEVPVPGAVAYEPDGGRFGSAGFLMGHVDGTSVASRLLRRDEYAEARELIPGQLAAALAGIHALDPHEVEGVPEPDGDPALAACALWEAALDEVGEPLPAVEAGLRWLRLNAPARPAALGLVHGDFRLGNFIAGTDGLAAVIDWELCHVGDPAEDIGWLVIRSWRFGNDELPVAGMGEIEAFLDAYEGAGGERPDAGRLRWWEAMGNVKWAVICARQAADHLTGRRRSTELASLGRRICEPEWDLLQLLAGEG